MLALLKSAIPALTTRLAALTPEALVAVGRRIGLAATDVTASNIIKSAMSNKLTAALVVYEVYGAGSELLKKFMKADPEIEKAIGALSTDVSKHKVSALSTHSLEEIVQHDDELQILSDAVRVVGSIERLLVLRQALALPDITYQTYRHTKAVGRSLA